MTYDIPFNKPFLAGDELAYIKEAVASGHTSGDGPFTKRCQELLSSRFGAGSVSLTTSCTSALELAAILCDIGPGDEVIMPSYTFVSTANAFHLRGATPVFVDIRRDTLNIDESLIEAAITGRTRAIVPVHYAGVSCEMDSILEIAKRHDLLVVEDAAQGVNAKYGERFLGTLGDIGTYSFHETKNFTCGEGGAILVNRPDWRGRAEVIREKGTNRSQFFRGQTDKYTWVDSGSSFLPSDLLAAYLFSQLEHMNAITERRRRTYEHYSNLLKPLADVGLIKPPSIPEGCTSNYHMFHIRVDGADTRARLIRYMRDRGILAVFHYVPLHTSPMGQRLGHAARTLPVTEKESEGLLRLPFYLELSADDRRSVAQALFDFFGVMRHDL